MAELALSLWNGKNSLNKEVAMKLRILFLITISCCFSILAQTTAYYTPPALSDPENFTVVMVPDTQGYVTFGRNHGILDLMAAWISENVEPLNIMTVVHVGDIVEANELVKLNPKRYNQSSKQMWACASNVFARLDGVVPYIMATGNHDYGIVSSEDRRTQFPDFFPQGRNSTWKEVLVECCVNRDGQKTLENAAYRFKLPKGSSHLLFVALEFAPSDPVIAWAKELFARPEYVNDIGVLVTHSYMRSLLNNNQLIVKEGYKITDVNYGQAIWEKLIYPSRNIRVVLCGHVCKPDDFRGSVGYRSDTNAAGKSVTQILFNTQHLGGGKLGNGGDGWLRLMEFSPDAKHVTVKTFSALYAISPSTQHLAWEKANYNNFWFRID